MSDAYQPPEQSVLARVRAQRAAARAKALREQLRTTQEEEEPVSDAAKPSHQLRLVGVPTMWHGWTLDCLHERCEFFTEMEDGTKESDDCWVQSWWEAVDADEIAADTGWPAVTLPVHVEGGGWDGCLLVPFAAVLSPEETQG